ncbi:MAG: Asparagine synthetase (glutamine-hydrolyzing) 1 [Syntrophus sp. PtaB.Bin001]|nr:MAG: Asparagine synthetase (glutamine-hydrolyzing) 1 [Syntrophus sp. PtaB.Bin001]
MCGIAGFFNPRGFSSDSASTMIQRMADRLAHRGPDDTGEWVDGEAGIALGHRRLSILDLSLAGHQPMISKSGSFVLIFNGEIYNHLAIRKEIDAFDTVRWHGHSDTETLLAGCDCWGIEATLKKTVGMFALAVWDRKECVLTLARDRMGEKPLYYGWQGDTFLFGSELKALRAHPAFRGGINHNVLVPYLRRGYIPAPYSIYQGIFKLLPGNYLQISGQQSPGLMPDPFPYWSLRQVVEYGLANPFNGTDGEAIKELETLLMDAVSLQSIADVPLGAFLSGGIDSSLIVALMQSQSIRPIKTFTIGFAEKKYNEAEHAKAVANYLGTDHTELYLTPQDAMAVIPGLPTLYDEPFGDSSQIPTFLVSQMTRRYVKVALSGDGGDELFGGYSRYARSQKIWTVCQHMPLLGRRWLAAGIRALPTGGVNRLLGMFSPGQDIKPPGGDKGLALAMLLSTETAEQFYQVKSSQWKNPDDLVIHGTEPMTVTNDPCQHLHCGNLLDRMMYIDAMSYLPDDILVKVDRAAMGVSLETRVPILDHRVVAFAWQLPQHLKVQSGQSKWLLRQVLYRHVPKLLLDRSKSGFSVPVDYWIRGPLREWAEELLAEEKLKAAGFFHPKLIRKCWKQHVSGQANWKNCLWSVLSLQAWLEEQ